MQLEVRTVELPCDHLSHIFTRLILIKATALTWTADMQKVHVPIWVAYSETQYLDFVSIV